MTTSVTEMDLPEVDLVGLGRDEMLRAFAEAAEQSWLIRTPLGYAVTRYHDVNAVLRDRRFHSAISLIPEMAGVERSPGPRRQQSILAMEGDEHTRLRRLASPTFTPRATDKLRPFMREVINELVDSVVAEGACEFVADICEPYPIPVICELLGAPKSDWRRFSKWAVDIFRIFNNDVANDMPAIQEAMAELDSYVGAMIEKRRHAPADDLLSRLIAAEEEGDRLSTAELVMMAEAVLMAGTDTTRNQLACCVALLAGKPDQWRALAQDPELAAPAVEECLRHLGAVRGTIRFASDDIDYRGVTFPKGTLVMASLAAANHDPEVWFDPGRFDMARQAGAASQMTFGSGIHFCLGASLARAELQEALPVLARRMPDLRVDGEVEWKPPTVGIWGPSRLPVAFTPTR